MKLSNLYQLGIAAFFFTSTFAAAGPAADIKEVQTLLTTGLRIQDELANDKLKETIAQSAKYAESLEEWLKANPTTDLTPTIKTLTGGVIAVAKLDPDQKPAALDKVIRKAYEPFGEGLVALIQDAKLTDKYTVYYCPMVKAYWARVLRDPKKTNAQNMLNPYMGTRMLACGTKKNWPVKVPS